MCGRLRDSGSPASSVGSGVIKASAPKPVIFSRRSTAGSPRVSTRLSCKTPRRGLTSWRDSIFLLAWEDSRQAPQGDDFCQASLESRPHGKLDRNENHTTSEGPVGVRSVVLSNGGCSTTSAMPPVATGVASRCNMTRRALPDSCIAATSGRVFPAVSFVYLSVECPFNRFYGINCRLKLGAKLLERFFHRRRQVSPPVNNARNKMAVYSISDLSRREILKMSAVVAGSAVAFSTKFASAAAALARTPPSTVQEGRTY